MTKKRKPYETYTKEFKLEAVRLMKESDKPSAELAAELGNSGDSLLISLISVDS